MTHKKSPQHRAFLGGTTQLPVKTVCKDTLSKPRKTPALREFVVAGVPLRHTGFLLPLVGTSSASSHPAACGRVRSLRCASSSRQTRCAGLWRDVILCWRMEERTQGSQLAHTAFLGRLSWKRWQVEDIVGVVALPVLTLIDLLVCRNLANETAADQFIYCLEPP